MYERLSGSQLRQLDAALRSAFPHRSALERMVRFQLNENLHEIADGNNMSEIIFSLIRWAEAKGKVKALLNGAIAENPDNQALKTCHEALRSAWEQASPNIPDQPRRRQEQATEVKEPRPTNSAGRTLSNQKLLAALLLGVLVVAGGYWLIRYLNSEPVPPATVDLCNAQENESAPTASATATGAAPTSTPTAVPTTPTPDLAHIRNTIVSEWEAILRDEFEFNGGMWPDGDFTDGQTWAIKTHFITNGVYQTTAKLLQQEGRAFANPNVEEVTDFFLAVDAKRVSGTPISAGYGVDFRFEDGQNHYRFVIRDDQLYRFDAFDRGELQPIVEWTKTEWIRPGASNNVAVLGRGSTFDFFINGAFVASVQDSRFGAGVVGVSFGVTGPQETFVFQFDNFELLRPLR